MEELVKRVAVSSFFLQKMGANEVDAFEIECAIEEKREGNQFDYDEVPVTARRPLSFEDGLMVSAMHNHLTAYHKPFSALDRLMYYRKVRHFYAEKGDPKEFGLWKERAAEMWCDKVKVRGWPLLCMAALALLAPCECGFV
jgi:hypothetical protein